MPSYLDIFTRDRVCGNVPSDEFNSPIALKPFIGDGCDNRYSLEERLSLIEENQNLLLQNEYKITYFEIIEISGATGGTITIPEGATIEEDEFGDAGNSVLSTLTSASKPTFETPQTSGGTIITANLDTNGDYIASNIFSDPVALIYSLTIKAKDLENLVEDQIIDFVQNGLNLNNIGTGLEWVNLVNSWTVEPFELVYSGSDGTVLQYQYGSTIYYRFVPEPYNSINDAFYESYSDPVLTNLIAKRGNSI